MMIRVVKYKRQPDAAYVARKNSLSKFVDYVEYRNLIDFEDGHDADNSKQSPADMTAFVQNLLQQMQTRFQTMSESIIGKIDEMGNRIDELEQSINDLRAEMGQEGSPSPSASLKTREEHKPAEDN